MRWAEQYQWHDSRSQWGHAVMKGSLLAVSFGNSFNRIKAFD
jgi:hypothetical protein